MLFQIHRFTDKPDVLVTEIYTIRADAWVLHKIPFADVEFLINNKNVRIKKHGTISTNFKNLEFELHEHSNSEVKISTLSPQAFFDIFEANGGIVHYPDGLKSEIEKARSLSLQN